MIADQAISDPEGQQELTGNFEQDYAEACKRLGVKPFAILKFGIPLPPLPYAPAALNESTAAPQGAGTAGTGGPAAAGTVGGDVPRTADATQQSSLSLARGPSGVLGAAGASGSDGRPAATGSGTAPADETGSDAKTAASNFASGQQAGTVSAGLPGTAPATSATPGAGPSATAPSGTAADGGPAASPASIQMGGANLNQVEDALYGSTQMLGPSASRNNQLGGKADNKKGSRLDLAASTMRLRPGTAGSHPPITTYTSRYRFRPTIDVETIDNEEEEEVYKIQVRGWRLSVPSTEAICTALSSCATITNLTLWNCGLSESHFSVLQSTASSLNIRTLFIDQNPQIPELLYANLLGEESVIKTLSLRGNNLTDAGVKLIAAALKTNRMLTNLNLWDNCITREGAEALAEVLCNYLLTPEELQVRRKQLAELDRLRHDMEDDANPKKKGRSGRGASAKQAEEKKDDKNKRSSKVPGKKGVESVPSSRPIKTPEDAKNKKQQAQSATSDDKKGKDKKSALASKGGKKMKVEDAKEDADDAGDSLNGIEPMFESNGQWYILGNRMLNSLNLSHNGITAIGLKALLDAVLDQEATNEQTPDGMLGIFRISLQHNPIDLDSPMHQQLQALLNSRNPFFEVLEAEAAADGALGEVAEIAQSESESVPEEAAA
ncbi:hypothetical protein HK105_203954 [Polyrhizophydium stewartii]|uniref:Uncharacterized protein n=1 Tax=Polyrhizophydium stewartii TaxID=2732419 RepID=A0ABR4NAI2_9FUNG